MLTGVKRTLQIEGRKEGSFAANTSAVASPALPACRLHTTANTHKLLMYSDTATLHCVWIHMLVSSIILLNTSPFEAGCLPPARDTQWLLLLCLSSTYMRRLQQYVC